MIDDIDRQIILSLRKNGRISNVDLSNELNLGVSTIAKRIDRILAEDVISIKAIINPFKMGYKAHAFIVLDLDLKKVENVRRELFNYPNISLMVTSFGRFDMILIVDFKDWSQLDDFVKNKLSQIEGVHKVDSYLVSEMVKRYQGIFENHGYVNFTTDIDDIDRKLITELQNDGRISYAKLAANLNIGIATVSRRISYLLRENLIKILAIPNPSKFGDIANAYIALNVDLKKINKVCDELAKERAIYLVMTMLNGFEIIIGVAFSKPELLYRFIVDKIAHMDGVLNLETFLRAEIVKANYSRLEFITEYANKF